MALMFIVYSAAVNSLEEYVKIVSFYNALPFFKIFWSRGVISVLEKSEKAVLTNPFSVVIAEEFLHTHMANN